MLFIVFCHLNFIIDQLDTFTKITNNYLFTTFYLNLNNRCNVIVKKPSFFILNMRIFVIFFKVKRNTDE